jgi:AP-1 complex subunit beta-1
MVVANAVAALSEVQESSNIIQSFALGSNTVYKLLAALNECTEWGQVIILDSISSYSPQNESQAESIIERVTPRLQHANCAVVLSAAKVIVSQLEVRGGSFTLKNIFMNMQGVQNSNTVSNVIRKLAPPLVTLLSAESEIQYVALRNINLIIQRYPGILKEEIKVFFCKYNDPAFVKQEKLETMYEFV